VIAVSIVTHGHGSMIFELTTQLLECPEISKIIITKNIYEEFTLPVSNKILVISNDYPKGFGANHNFAFNNITEEYFCPLNPDIKLLSNPFPKLINNLIKYNSQLAAPLVLNRVGKIEDSVRYFPTFLSLVRKLFFINQGQYKLKYNGNNIFPDWVAGMFMLFTSNAFKKLNGFDENYFLYYEDVDICARLWILDMRIIVVPTVYVIHDARRASRNNFSHMKLHIQSMVLYFYRYLGKLPKRSGAD